MGRMHDDEDPVEFALDLAEVVRCLRAVPFFDWSWPPATADSVAA